ncbi:MAG TPA: hypothetical protein DC054_19505 [Blastocatellia bacterium]|nr:hypothetical protein [Blastocatellia bacterium]
MEHSHPIRKTRLQILGGRSLTLLMFAFLMLAQGTANAQKNPQPFSLKQVIDALDTHGYNSTQWVNEIRQNKVAFEVDRLSQSDLARLRASGAYLGHAGFARVLNALRANYHPAPIMTLCTGVTTTNGESVDSLITAGNEAMNGFVPRLATALTDYCSALELAPNEPRAHLGLGDIYSFQERDPEAIREYKEAVRLKPDFFEAHYVLCLSYLRVEDGPSTAKEYNATLKLDAKKGELWLSGVMLDSPVIPTHITRKVNHLFADYHSLKREKQGAALSTATAALKDLTPNGQIGSGLSEAGIFHFLKQSIETWLGMPDGQKKVEAALGFKP